MEDAVAIIQSSYPHCADEVVLIHIAFPNESKIAVGKEGFSIIVLVTPGVQGVPVNVSVTLEFLCSFEYPSTSPIVNLIESIGLSESSLMQLRSAIDEILEFSLGEFVIYSTIDRCRDFISTNIPSVECSICFDAFKKEEDVHRTPCNHFFHNNCLSDYHKNLLNAYLVETAVILSKNPNCPKDMRPKLEFPCPMCKSELTPLVDIPTDFS